MAELTFDAIGKLFCTASAGGASGGGTIFRLEPTTDAWIVSVLHAFTGTPDGSYPSARTTFDESGNLYGTTQQGGYTGASCGYQGCGTVFIAVP